MSELYAYRYWTKWYSAHIKSNADCLFAMGVFKRLWELEIYFINHDYQI